jgi:small subunit ribosomal protein S17
MSRRVITGNVIANSQDKTITIRVVERKTHPLYRKQYSSTSKYRAHDPKNEAQIGDLVEIEECPPVSRSKRWQLKTVVTKETSK